MKTITLNEQESFDLLNEEAISKRFASLLNGNAIFWDVPKDFDHSILGRDFELWVIDETFNTIRFWSKW